MKHFRKKSLAMLTALTLSASALAACAPTAALKAVEANYPVPAAEEKNAQTFAEARSIRTGSSSIKRRLLCLNRIRQNSAAIIGACCRSF